MECVKAIQINYLIDIMDVMDIPLNNQVWFYLLHEK